MQWKSCFAAAPIVLFVFLSAAVHARNGLWRPYYELDAFGSSHRWGGGGDVSLPIWQDCSRLLMANMRVFATDRGSTEGNFGMVHRSILDCNRILGLYGFYDLRSTRADNVFHQGSAGIELLDVQWGLRANGYVPEQSPKSAPGSIAFFEDGNIFVRRGLEAAYWGADVEAEGLLWCCRHAGLPVQLWAAAGAFHFDNGSDGFRSLTGPQVRTELRLFDLPMLGVDSRLVLHGQYQYDGQRGSVGSGLLSLRVPFGYRSRRTRSPLTGLRRRMVAPVVRDIDVVTQAGPMGRVERAKIARTGSLISNVVVLTAEDDLSAEIESAGPDSVVMLDGSRGEFFETDASFLSEGQVVMGGRSLLPVIGCETGATATLQGPGSRPLVRVGALGQGTIQEPVFVMSDHSTIQGIDVLGGSDGIQMESVNNILIYNNVVRGAVFDGIASVEDTVTGHIINNVVTQNGGNGIVVNEFRRGRIRGNLVTANGDDGIEINELTGGMISRNTVLGNFDDGFDIDEMHGGVIQHNRAVMNSENGFDVDYIAGGMISRNTARENFENGFDILDMEGGTLSRNISHENLENGFSIVGMSGGRIARNTAASNVDDGFDLMETEHGVVHRNVAWGNLDDGFDIDGGWNGRLTDNVASNNSEHGFEVIEFTNGVAGGNVARTNGDAGFDVAAFHEGVMAGNLAERNNGAGYRFFQIDGGVIDDNLARGNRAQGFSATADGFTVGNTNSFSRNEAIRNLGAGYEVLTGSPMLGQGTNEGRGNSSNNRY